MDIYPTVLDVAGVSVPKDYVLDGSSMTKLFAGKKDKRRRDDVLIHFPHNHRGSYFSTYRKGDWKIIYYYNPDKDGVPSYRLYNLKEDPYEKTDLALDNPEKLNEMCRMMIERLKLEGALYPVGNNGRTLYPVMPE